ncbi:MAG: hypothetical protein V7750_19290 [Sneathiella sp.]
MGKSLRLLISFLTVITLATPAFAKDFIAVYQDAEIAKAVVSAGANKNVGTLQLKLTNTAVGSLTIIGVKGASHKNSKIVAQLGPAKYVELESLPILSEETLDMEDAGIFIQLHDMEASLKNGSVIELDLILLNGEMPFRAHVIKHSAQSTLLN